MGPSPKNVHDERPILLDTTEQRRWLAALADSLRGQPRDPRFLLIRRMNRALASAEAGADDDRTTADETTTERPS